MATKSTTKSNGGTQPDKANPPHLELTAQAGDLDEENTAAEDTVAPEPGATDVPLDHPRSIEPASISSLDPNVSLEDALNALKALVGAVERLQKVKQEVGDIKPLITRMLDGELMSGEELESLKLGVAGLGKLAKAYTEHQQALAKAQPAKAFLDTVMDARSAPRS